MTNRVERTTAGSPGDEYRRRLEARRTALSRLVRAERGVSDLRLGVFILGVVMAWFVFAADRLAMASLLVPLVVFVALVVGHEPLRRAAHRASRAVVFYEKGLARLEDRWAGTGESGERFLDPAHPYAADLDLFGRGSLFERLCTARTRAGEETLAAWLMHPAGVDEVGERQAAVSELRGRLDLREEIELLGSDLRAGIDPEALAAWGSEPRAFPSGRVAIAVGAAVLAALAVAALIGWGLFETGPSPFCAVALVEILVTAWTSRRVRRVLAGLDQRTHDLVILSALLARLEHESFETPALAQAPVGTGDVGRARLAADREAGAAAPLAQLPAEPVLHADRGGPPLVLATGAGHR